VSAEKAQEFGRGMIDGFIDGIEAAALRIIVMADTKARGYAEACNLGIEPVAVVTPRTLHIAHGVVADRIMEATSLTPEQRDALLPHVLPCLATSTRTTN
jgi:hypothetical protein